MMTDDELKELVASLAVSQKETSTQQKETSAQIRGLRVAHEEINAQQKETSAQIRDLRVEHEEINAQQKETSAQQKETSAQQKETSAQIRALRVAHEEINAQQRETSRKLDKVAKMIGGIGHNQGDVAEDFFYNSFIKDNRLGEFSFNEIIKNMTMHKGETQEEYDLLLINGETIVVIEIKYKAHQKDINKLDRKTNNFKKLFPLYHHFNVYGAMASFHFNETVKERLLQEGYFVVERSGKLINTKSGDHLKVA